MTFHEALRALAARIETFGSVRGALAGWPEVVAGPLAPAVTQVAGRIRLGASVPDAFEPLESIEKDATRVASLIELTAASGGSVATAIRHFAASLERRETQAGSAAAAAAGARASARMLAWLPAAGLLFVAGDGGLIDDFGLGLTACGMALALAGSRWIDRLTAAPPIDSTATATAELAAAQLEAGGHLHSVMNEIARRGDTELRIAAGRVGLGMPWPAALMRSGDPELVSVGRALERSVAAGLPACAVLTAFASERREAMEAEFERRNRAAPVRMVVPLVLCGLPAFCLITLTPLLRALPLG